MNREQIESIRQFCGYETGPDLGQWADVSDPEILGKLCDLALRGLEAGETDAAPAGMVMVPRELAEALRNWSGYEPSQSVLAREVDAWRKRRRCARKR